MIIGLAGEAGSGKDSFADVLVEKQGYQKLSFAKNLKEMCREVFGLSDYDVYTQEGKKRQFSLPMMLKPGHLVQISKWVHEKTPGVKVDPSGLSTSIIKYWETEQIAFPSPRELLQFVGTEICRECYSQNYHIDVVKSRIDWKGKVVIADARFKNEREAVKSWEGLTIKVVDPAMEKTSNVGIAGHASETEMGDDADFDGVFLNHKEEGFGALEVKSQAFVTSLKNSIFGKHA